MSPTASTPWCRASADELGKGGRRSQTELVGRRGGEIGKQRLAEQMAESEDHDQQPGERPGQRAEHADRLGACRPPHLAGDEHREVAAHEDDPGPDGGVQRGRPRKAWRPPRCQRRDRAGVQARQGAVEVGEGAAVREQQAGADHERKRGRAQHEGRALRPKVELAAPDHEQRVGGQYRERHEEGAVRRAQAVGQVPRPGGAAVGGPHPGERRQPVLHGVEAAEADEQAEVRHGGGVDGKAERRAERPRDRDVVATRARESHGQAHVEQVERQNADEGQQHGEVEVGPRVEAGTEQREPHQANADVGVHDVEAEHLPGRDLAHQTAGRSHEGAHRRCSLCGLV